MMNVLMRFIVILVTSIAIYTVHDTGAIMDKFTIAAYLERLAHYNIKFQERHAEILGLNNVLKISLMNFYQF